MIAEIEESIINLLREKWDMYGGGTRLNEIDINLDFEDVINYPAISVVTDTVAVRKIVRGEATIEFKPTIVLYQIFKSQKPQQRRHGVYPIVVASIRLLTGQMLGLEIEPLVPVSTSEIFHEKLKTLGAVGFQTRFTTSFEVEPIDDEDVIRLFSEGLYYYNGNDAAASKQSDVITYSEG